MSVSVKDKMTPLANAIRLCTSTSDTLSFDEMLTAIADFVGYDISDIKDQLWNMSRVEKFTVMADIVRAATGETSLLSLSKMAELIRFLANAVAKNGVRYYDSLEEAITVAKSGDTVTLLRDIDVGSLCNVSISKDLTIDGNGHSIKRSYAGENLFVIQESVTFNVCHLNVEFNSIAKNWFIHSVDVSSNVNITDCILKSERGVIFLDYSSGSLTVKNSTIQGSASLYLLGGSPEVYIQNSSVCGDNGQALYLSGTGASVTISDSSISANNTTLGAIDVRNCSPTIDLKGTTKILIDENTHASIRMRGSANCDPIITLYNDVKLTEGVRSHIYYTAYGKRTGFHVKFAYGYQGAKYKVMSTTDSTRNCRIWLENSLDAAYSHLSGIVDVFAFDENVANEAKKRGFTVKFDDALGGYAILGHAGHCYWTEDDITIEAETKITWEEGSTVNIESVEVTSCKYTINDSELVKNENLWIDYTWFWNGFVVADGKIFRGDITPLSANDAIELEVRVVGSLSDNQGCESHVEKILHKVVWGGPYQL